MTDLTTEAVKAALDARIEYQWDHNSPLEGMAPDLAREYLRLEKVEEAGKELAKLVYQKHRASCERSDFYEEKISHAFAAFRAAVEEG